MENHLKKKSIEEQGRKQPETLQSWKPNEQQMQVYQPRMKSAEDISRKFVELRSQRWTIKINQKEQ